MRSISPPGAVEAIVLGSADVEVIEVGGTMGKGVDPARGVDLAMNGEERVLAVAAGGGELDLEEVGFGVRLRFGGVLRMDDSRFMLEGVSLWWNL